MRELVRQHGESDGSRVWDTRTRAGVDGRLVSVAAFLNWDKTGVLPYSPPKTGGKSLPTGPDPEAQKKQKNLLVTVGESVGYCFTATGTVSASPYFTPISRFYEHYSGAQKKPLNKIFVVEEVHFSPTPFFLSLGCVQHAGSKRQRKKPTW